STSPTCASWISRGCASRTPRVRGPRRPTASSSSSWSGAAARGSCSCSSTSSSDTRCGMPLPNAATSDVHTTLRRLPGNAEAAALARRAVEKLPLPDELRDTLWLLVTELVSTSVRGAAAGRAANAMMLQVAVLGRAARAELYDWHPGASDAAM